MSTSALRQRIRDLVEPTTERMGFVLVAVQWLPTGPSGRPTLRLSIDGPDGVDLDDTARVNQRLSLLLDEADPIPSAYDLEVSSPGIDRPVQRFVDFNRFSGFRAKITLEEGFPRRRYTGELRGTEVGGSDASPPGETVLIEVDGVVHRLPFVHIETAHLVLDLAAYARLAPPKLRKEDRETVDVEG